VAVIDIDFKTDDAGHSRASFCSSKPLARRGVVSAMIADDEWGA
jgi:hypothetical protein